MHEIFIQFIHLPIFCKFSVALAKTRTNFALYVQGSMKSKDRQKSVFSKFKIGESPSKISRDLKNVLSCGTVSKLHNMIRKIGNIKISHQPSYPHNLRSKKPIQKVKVTYKKSISIMKLDEELEVTVQRLFINYIEL